MPLSYAGWYQPMLNLKKFHSSTRPLIQAGIADGSKAFTGPEHVVIDLTNRCNNTCIACWTRSPLLGKNAPDPGWHKETLDLQRTLKLIDELYCSGTTIIRLTGGGEPFMHPGVLEIIRAVKSHGIFCSLTTNLNLINLEIADELVAIGIDEISVSLWASTPDEYVKTHPNQTPHAFEKITRVLKHIAQKKRIGRYTDPKRWFKKPFPKISILNVICNLNYDSVVGMFDYALQVEADSIYYTVVDTIEGATDSLLLSDEQRNMADQLCKTVVSKNACLPIGRRITLDNFSGFRTRLQQATAAVGRYDQNTINSIPCYIGWIFCRIMANGQVAPCCRGVQIPMGNINNHSLAEIWHSSKYNKFRTRAKNRHKSDLYFSEVGCSKTCDNLMHNMEVHHWLDSEAG